MKNRGQSAWKPFESRLDAVTCLELVLELLRHWCGTCLELVLNNRHKPSGICLEPIWNLYYFEPCLKPTWPGLEAVWKPSGNCLEAVWKPSGSRLEAVWKPSGTRLEAVWNLCLVPSTGTNPLEAGILPCLESGTRSGTGLEPVWNHRLEPLSATVWLNKSCIRLSVPALRGCDRERCAVFQCASDHMNINRTATTLTLCLSCCC